MKSGRSYKNYSGETHFDVVVIGSGMGGLTLAAFLARRGKKVLVLERHYTVGGFTHVFKRRDYEWDVGIHYLGDVHAPVTEVAKIFRYVTDGNMKWAEMADNYDRMIFPDQHYDFVKRPENFRAKMKSYFPDDAEAIDQYMATIKKVTGWRSKVFFAEKAIPKAVSSLAGGLMRRGMLQYAGKTTAEVMDGITDNQRLKAVLCGQFGDYGLPPSQSSFAIQAMVASHYMYGACYPVGGSATIADSIVPVIEDAGGKVLVRADVKEVMVKNGKAVGVRLNDGGEFTANNVVSDAGYWNTMYRLLPEEYRKKVPSMESIGLSASVGHVCLYLGLKHTAEELKLPRTNYWVYPSYDHDKNIADYTANPDAPLPVAYISFPAAKDPDFVNRFPGRSTIEIITLSPYEWYEKWADKRWRKRGEDYEAFKQKITERLLEKLYETVPQVKGKIDFMELSTPLSTEHFANYARGELYGLNHGPDRFRCRSLKPHTPVRNLYLTGQDVVTAGVAGAMFGGVLTASAMMTRNLIGDAIKWNKKNPI